MMSGMQASEYVAFVTWATDRDPKWTLSRRAHVQARWDWRTVSKHRGSNTTPNRLKRS
jgi:hypothetical protein